MMPVGVAPRLVSVIVPTRNAEPWISDQLRALEAQTYPGDWEVLVVDNGCTDRSIEIAGSFAHRLPALRIVDARRRRSLNHARNVGAQAARGDFLAFCDADDVVAPSWLGALVAAAPGADIIGGALEVSTLNPPELHAWRPVEPPRELEREHGFLPYAAGGNCGIWTSVARELEWDERFRFGSSDVEFCWRAQLRSYTTAFAGDAVVMMRYRRSLARLVAQYFAYGRSGPLLYRAFRAQGMPRDVRGGLWWWRWIVSRPADLVRSRARRGYWLRTAAFRCGRLVGSVAAGVFFP